jgi:peptidoglycan/LPS O-acetylase OafA/YrhL
MPRPKPAAHDLPVLTGLRAVAVAGVLACHFAASSVSLLALGPNAERVFILGGYGVSLFFVLSGFILCHAYSAATWTKTGYIRFLLKRLARIYPLHIAVLVSTLALYEGVRPWGYNQPVFDLTLFLRHATLTQAWWDYTMGMWNQASWSISAEGFAYLCFPAVVWVMRGITSPWLALVAAHAVLIAHAGWMQMLDVDIAFVGGSALPNIAANFVAGCCAYRAWDLWDRASLPAWVAFAALGAAMTLTAVVVAMHAVGWWLTLPFPLLILGLGASDTLVARLLSRPLTQILGKSSYAA